jgi:ABC-type molybdate transport system substrate-binding protein
MEVPLIHLHIEIITVTTLENIDPQLGEMVLVGPFPKEIQNTTTYAAGLSASAQNKDAAQALIKAFSSPVAASVLKSKGMDPAG